MRSSADHPMLQRVRGRRTRSAHRGPWSGLSRAVAGVLVPVLALLGTALLPAAASAEEGDAGSVIQIQKTILAPTTGTIEPGDSVTYQVEVNCSAVNDGLGCTDAVLTDPVPAPLVFQPESVSIARGSGGLPAPIDQSSGNTLQIAFQDVPGPGLVGMLDGSSATVTFSALLPADVSADVDGIPLVNVASFDATNAVTHPRTASAPITPHVPTSLSAGIQKSGSPASVVGIAGRPESFTVRAWNASNRAVDALVVQDPADAATEDPFELAALTGIGTLTAPQGADRVALDWLDADGDWHTGSAVPIPSDPDALLAGVTLADVHGLRFRFSNSLGRLPATGSAAGAVIELDTVLRDAVNGIAADTSILDLAQAVVLLDSTSSPVATASASIAVELARLGPIVEKQFVPAAVNAGATTTARIHAENGDYPIVEMTVTEPRAGDIDLVAQGLTFQDFVHPDVEWPEGATAATIQYVYEDAFAEAAKPATGPGTLPAPTDGHRVTGFTVDFTGDIVAHAYAELPFTAVADAVLADTTLTNLVGARIETAAHEVGTADASADLTRRTVRLSPTVEKELSPEVLYGIAGSNLRADLPATIKATELPDGSTVGAQRLTVSDPAAPTSTIDPFWDAMDVVSIPSLAVPNNAYLAVEWWDGEDWHAFPGAAQIAGPTLWSYAVPTADRAAIEGVRFVFTPKTPGALLQPGFEVVPHIGFAVREDLRSDPGTPVVVNAPGGVDVVETNTARATTRNDAVLPAETSVDAQDEILLHPLYGGGPGPDLLEKGWVSTDGSVDYSGLASIDTRTQDQLTSRLSWSTGGLPFSQVVISEPAAPMPLTDSFLDAFDIVQVKPITTELDPWLAADRVVGVQRYSLAEGDWIDAEGAACTTSSPCDGAFPGYTVPAPLRDDTAGIRLVIDGGADGASVSASTAGRAIDIVFQIRDALRSDPGQAVLATGVYNLAAPGQVRNTAGVVGTLPDDSTYDDEDSAETGLIDLPVNVSTTKSWDQDLIGIPQAGTDQAEYPVATATVTATNETAARVDELTIQDPDPSPDLPGSVPGAGEDAFDVFDLWAIRSITVPEGATSTEVVLRHASGPDTVLTIAAATAIEPGDDQFADVVGVDVRHAGRIAAGASSTIVLDFQLRAENRETHAAAAQGDVAVNGDRATAADAGRTKKSSAFDSITLAQPSYAVATTKDVSPAQRYEDDADRSVTVSLTARPDRDATVPNSAAVRTTLLTVTDDTPTFWNAYRFTALRPIALPAPVERVKVDALVGVAYSLVGGDLVAECDGDADLADCWVEGVWQTPGGGSFTPAMPAGVAAADVRGLRWSYDRADGSNWERPYNPSVPAGFTADRLVDLRYGIGGATDTPVPSTLPTLAAAPGESAKGTTTDTVQTHAEGSWGMPGGSPWTASASATDTTVLRHRQNSVKVEKAPTDAVRPGVDIPYKLIVTNDGDWPMTGLTIVDDVEGDATGPLVAPAVRDLGDTTPVYGATLAGAGGGALTPPTVTPHETVHPAPGGMTIAFELPADFVLQPGQVLTLTVAMRYRGDLAVGTVAANSVTVDSDRIFDRCTGTVNRVPQAPVATVETCTATTTVYSLPSSPISVVKGVKGVGAGVLGAAPGDPNYDDLGVLAYSGAPSTAYCDGPNGSDGFYRHPCVPITRPGGEEQWRVWFTNGGNVNAQVLAGIDVLPASNDRGVIVDQPRSSRWAPEFIGGLSLDGFAGATAQVYYLDDAPTTACNRLDILNVTKPGGITSADVDPGLGETTACLSDIASRSWQLYDEGMSAAAKADIAAFKIVITYPEGTGLAPGATGTLTYSSRTAAYPERGETTDRDSIAWNSIAVGARGIQDVGGVLTPQVSLVGEARKTGVAMATGKIELSKEIVTPGAWDYPLPDDYSFQLQCTSNGVPVPIRGTASEALGTVTAPASGATVSINNGINTGVTGHNAWSNINLPLYAECGVVEDPSQGATASYSPATVTALRDFVTRADVANPAFGSTSIPLEHLEATNTYEFGGFTVSKSVDEGGALAYPGGAAIERDGPYSFSASCTFNGSNVLSETFTLVDGASWSSDDLAEVESVGGLPAGAVCTVTEGTGSGGADLASTTIDRTGAVDSQTPGKTITFTLSPYGAGDQVADLLEFENEYTVGALQVRKSLTGAGAALWAGGSFEIEVECTLASATPSAVYHRTFTLQRASAGDTTIDGPVMEDIPTGASCAISETATGGATTAAATTTVTVGSALPASPQVVTRTNDFRTGTVQVTKVLVGSPAASLAPATGHVYDFEISCTRVVNGVTASIDAEIPGGTTRTVTGAGSAQWTGLPTGASCAVSETDDGLATSTAITETSGTANDGTVAVGDGTTQTVTVTNTFGNGSVPVRKTVDGPGAAFAPASFSATLSCTWNGAAVPLPASGAITVTDGATTTVSGVPIGSVCSVAEADAGQSLPSPSSPLSVTVTDGATPGPTPALELTNTYELASLTVSKSVVTSSTPVPTGFDFLVGCTFNGDPLTLPGGGAFSLDDGGSKTFTGLPARADCTISETDDRGADSVVADGASASGDAVWTPDATDPHVIAVAELSPDVAGATQNSVEYENWFGVAGISVRKEIRGGAAERGASPEAFPIQVVCSYGADVLVDETPSLSSASPVASWSTVVPGADCAITELDSGEADAVTYEVSTDGTTWSPLVGAATIPATGAVQVRVTNWYLTGSLTVTKAFEGAAAAAYGTREYPVRLSCELDGDDYPIPGGALRTLEAPSIAEPDADVTVYTDLPSGADCHLAELDAGGATSTRIVETATHGTSGEVVVSPVDAVGGADLTITVDPGTPSDADQPQTALSVVNRYDYGSIEITKVLAGAGAGFYDGWDFEFTAACTFLGSPIAIPLGATRTATPSSPAVYEDLPVGADCTITESEEAGATSSLLEVAGGASGSGDAGVAAVVSAAAPAVTGITATNTYPVGRLDVSKVLTGVVDAPLTTSFQVSLSCTLDVGDAAPVSIPIPGGATRALDAGGSWAAAYTGLPTGALCDLTESQSNSASGISISVGGDTATTGATRTGIAIPAGTTSAVVTNHYPSAGLVLMKTVSSGALDADGDPVRYGPFDFTVTCEYLGQPVAATGTTLTAGAMAVQIAPLLADGGSASTELTGLPAGADCEIVEADAAGVGGRAYTVKAGDDPVTPGQSLVLAADVAGETTNAAAVANAYTTGSLQLVKSVVGPGAGLAGREFVIEVVCTTGTGPTLRTVFDGTRTLSGPLLLSATIDDLPTGAACAVTETDTAGADEVSVTPSAPVVIGDATVVTVNVVNTYLADEPPVPDAGAVEVTLAEHCGPPATTFVTGGTVFLLDVATGTSFQLSSTSGSEVVTIPAVPPGDYEVWVYPPAGYVAPEPFTITVPANDTVEVCSEIERPTPRDPRVDLIDEPPTGWTGLPQYPGGSEVPFEITPACAVPLSATFEVHRAGGPVVLTGTLVSDGAGGFLGTVPAMDEPGAWVVTVTVNCDGEPDEVLEFTVYIDPSGNVVSEEGDPVEGCVVTLYRSDTGLPGSFVMVPDGSPFLDPATPRNPQTTGPDGAFGWDVVPGFYIVESVCLHGGTTFTEFTSTLEVPPPHVGLRLKMTGLFLRLASTGVSEASIAYPVGIGGGLVALGLLGLAFANGLRIRRRRG